MSTQKNAVDNSAKLAKKIQAILKSKSAAEKKKDAINMQIKKMELSIEKIIGEIACV